MSILCSSAFIFQFTPLREGRRLRGLLLRLLQFHFNSRPSARGDQATDGYMAHVLISIHAPPRGATGFTDEIADADIISIHAPPRGATEEDTPAAPEVVAFQFTPLREGRRNCLASGTGFIRFQFTPLREGRLFDTPADNVLAIFQFTPLREGRRQKICNFCKSFVQPLQISMA